MKKFVINLKRRPDRKEHFIKTNTILTDYTFVDAVDGAEDLSRYKTRPGWIDPFQNRDIIPTEVACFLSHREMWIKCVELDEPIYVIEDDAIINVDRWDEPFYEHTIKYWDFLVGIVVFLSISFVETPPSVSIPNDKGVTSNNNTSLTSP